MRMRRMLPAIVAAALLGLATGALLRGSKDAPGAPVVPPSVPPALDGGGEAAPPTPAVEGRLIAESPEALDEATAGPLDRFGEQAWVFGLVRAIDLGKGTLRLSSGPERLVLHARPEQLMAFRPGDQGEFGFVDYGGVAWLPHAPGRPSPLDGDPVGRRGVAIGVLTELTPARGEVRVRVGSTARLYRAHPEELRKLLPGHWVKLEFRTIGGADWIRTIRLRRPRSPAGVDRDLHLGRE